jgi:hypothetical protein
MKKLTLGFLVLGSLLVSGTAGQGLGTGYGQAGRDKLLESAYALVSQADIYCSFRVLERPGIMDIISDERGGERSILSEGDIFFARQTGGERVLEGQLMAVLEIGPKISLPGKKLGPIAYMRGRARLIQLERGVWKARIEKACAPISPGEILIPFEDREGLLGNDLGYQVRPKEGAPSARIIFMDSDYVQLGPGQWGLINLGTEDRIQFGQQLAVFREVGRGLPLEAVANLIVIDAGRFTSTIKVLSARDAVTMDDLVQVR